MSLRRAQEEKPISVFAFQDVMTTVMGTMLAITMTMALDLTAKVTEKAAEAAEVTRLEAGDTGTRTLGELNTRAAELEALCAKKRSQVERLGALVPGRDADKAQALALELEQLSAQVRKVEAEIIARQGKLKNEATSQAAKDLLAKQAEYEQRAAKLKGTADGLRANPQFSYVAPQGISEQPILLEIRADRIALATAKAGGDMNAITGRDAKDLMAQLGQMVDGLDPKQAYFFLLIRPSAFGGGEAALGAQVEDLLKKKGFRYGKDLVGEKTRVRPFDTN